VSVRYCCIRTCNVWMRYTVDWSRMNGTVYQGSLSQHRFIALIRLVQGKLLPVRLDPGRFCANLLGSRLDLMVFDPHGLVRQLLVVEGVTNGTAHIITASVVGIGYPGDAPTVYSVSNTCLHGQSSGWRHRRTGFRRAWCWRDLKPRIHSTQYRPYIFKITNHDSHGV